jgi:beta-glucanase (GH16 family)
VAFAPRIALLAFVVASPALLAARGVTQASATSSTIFFDDFSTGALDRARWNVIVTGRTVNNEQQAYVDSPDTLAFLTGDAEGASNGALVIQARWRPGHLSAEGRSYDFVSARLESRGKVEFMHGTAAARMKLPAGDGFWPAFWLLGTGRWPDTGEIDVMENVGVPSWTNVAIHGPGYSGSTPFVARTEVDATAWHIYRVDWTTDAMTFFVDDREIYRATRPMIERYGVWAFDDAKYLIVNLALGGGYPRSVNHADAPYPGLPAATVDLIKAGRGRVLVDWVRVTRS